MRRRGKSWLVAFGILIFFAGLNTLAGCGNGAGMSAKKASNETHSSPTERGHLMLPPHLPARFRSEGCVSAKAVLGRNPGEINVFVRCTSHRGPSKGNAVVGRYVAGDPAVEASISAYRLKSRGFKQTQCRRSTQAVACDVYGRRSGILKMKILVPPHTRCSAGVSIGTRRLGACAHEPCIGAVFAYSLFMGRPRGC